MVLSTLLFILISFFKTTRVVLFFRGNSHRDDKNKDLRPHETTNQTPLAGEPINKPPPTPGKSMPNTCIHFRVHVPPGQNHQNRTNRLGIGRFTVFGLWVFCSLLSLPSLPTLVWRVTMSNSNQTHFFPSIVQFWQWTWIWVRSPKHKRCRFDVDPLFRSTCLAQSLSRLAPKGPAT